MRLTGIIWLCNLLCLNVAAYNYEGFDVEKCLGKNVGYKYKDFDKNRAEMKKRSESLKNCCKCIRDEKSGKDRDYDDEDDDDVMNPYRYFFDFRKFDLDFLSDSKAKKLTPAFCEKDARDAILKKYQSISIKQQAERSTAEWKWETDLTAANNAAYIKVCNDQQKTQQRLSKLVQLLATCDNLGCREKRMIYPATSSVQYFPDKLADKKTRLSSEISTIYSNAKVCIGKKCYHYEPGIIDMMAKSRDYDKLLKIWKGWRDAIGPKVRNDWICEQVIRRMGSQSTGYEDVSEDWKSVYNDNNFVAKLDAMWDELKPLYEQFHAYVRGRLRIMYGADRVSDTGPIPAHILGNIWSMTWHSLYNDVKPFKDIDDFEVTQGMKKKGITVMKMFHLADEFYQSMGLPAMPASFWKKSMFVRPKDGRPVVCYASAHNLQHTDVRVKMCAQLNSNYFYVAHHEMGHCQYFLAYNTHQPYLFQNGANPAFHEAIGDTAALSVINPNHLTKLGILEKTDTKSSSFKKQQLNFLMSRALEKLPLFGFALSLEKWRWDFFSDDIPDGKVNKRWWDRKLQYQGVKPAVERTEKDFDPVAKYHVATNVPYIRYFLSHVLQFQFYDSLCKAAKHKGPLYNCDFGDSKEAGKIFKRMLDEGTSKHWKDILKEMTGSCDVSTKSVLKYFKPLHDWLKVENKRLGNHVGW